MMLHIPRVPTVKGFSFGNVEAHQTRRALAVEIRATIEALLKSTYAPGWQGMFYKFIDCIEPGRERDLARLPYPSDSPNDRRGTNIGCVYARLSFLIQLYWSQCLDGADNTERVRACLNDLRGWAARGIDKCKMAGNPRDGYWLEIE